MNLDKVTRALNTALQEHEPALFSSSWVYHHAPQAYWYIWRYVKTPLGNIDWDAVVCKLDRTFQKRWTQRRPKVVRPYRKIHEVRTVLRPFQEKLYIFIAPVDQDDRLLRDAISIALVRVAQRGNIRARQELLPLLRYMVDEWIEHSPKLWRWKGCRDDIDETLTACVRRYRFTGSFIGYLFKTLEYAGRGLRQMEAYSLDETIFEGDRRKVDSVVQDMETGEIKIFDSRPGHFSNAS